MVFLLLSALLALAVAHIVIWISLMGFRVDRFYSLNEVPQGSCERQWVLGLDGCDGGCSGLRS